MGKELHDPTRIPVIVGIDKPFELILEKGKKILNGEIQFDGSRQALETFMGLTEVQKRVSDDYSSGQEVDIDAAKSLLGRGLPALGDEYFDAPSNKFVSLVQETLEALGVDEGELINITDKMVELTGGEKNLIIPITAFPDDLLARLSEETGTTVHILKAAINGAWQVFIIPVTSGLHSQVEHEFWDQSVCPICGSQPEMGKIQVDEGHFYLSCPLCLTEWKHLRLKCPWCGNEDQKKLGYFSAEEYPGYRVNFCKNCNGYIKVAIEKSLNREFMPTLDYLLTLELDSQAEREGFKKPG
jgi:FdhE protein